VEHAKMLLVVHVDTPDEFEGWVRQQQQSAADDATVSEGRKVFESESCINCHSVRGTVANGRFGPDLTHLMSRNTIASGAIQNTPENLKRWIADPDTFKRGSLMPSMHLTEQQLDQLTAYLTTLK
jgi:cytochrome c oxidase subunit 2